MRRLISITGAIALTAALAAPATATPPLPPDGHKVLVCHATSSATNPYLAIVVDIASAGGFNKYKGHQHHVDEPNKKNGADYIQGFTWDGVNFTLTESIEDFSVRTGLDENCDPIEILN